MVIASTMKKPEIMVFAGPNGSGKSSVTRLAKLVGVYVNADDIRASLGCSDLEAAQIATSKREELVSKQADFTFETVLSTTRNIDLLKAAKDQGYFIRCIYILTTDCEINVSRVHSRVANGGHSVPDDKIRSRYIKALSLIPQIIDISDVMHIYDNTVEPYRIFKKRKQEYWYWENAFWSKSRIESLTKISFS